MLILIAKFLFSPLSWGSINLAPLCTYLPLRLQIPLQNAIFSPNYKKFINSSISPAFSLPSVAPKELLLYMKKIILLFIFANIYNGLTQLASGFISSKMAVNRDVVVIMMFILNTVIYICACVFVWWQPLLWWAVTKP